jgi:hypothetical protein
VLVRKLKPASVIDFFIFFLSAVVITGVILGIQHKSWLTISGYLLALFWMLVSKGLRGALRSSQEANKILQIISEEQARLLDEKEKK